MRKIVIFQDVEVKGKKVRQTLRAIQPMAGWQGYAKNGSVIDSEARNLARYLEPNNSGYFVS
jgi:hypothetical protein